MKWVSLALKSILASFFLLFCSALLTVPCQVGAVSKGIRVVSCGGQSLYFYKDYHALVVGVSNYDKWPALTNAVRDAREVSWLLKRMGFKVTLVTDPNSEELKKALNDLAQEAGQEPDRGVVFYYAGHGETQTLADGSKLGFIVPRDCPLLREDLQGFATRAISTKAIETYSALIRSKHVLMFFDSSFSGGVFSLEPAVLKVISEKTALPARQYIISGKEDEPIPERSVFKRFLLKGLKGDADLIHDGYITGSELGVYLADRVVKTTKGRQHPEYGKISNPALARGDFVFQVVETKPDTGRLFVETNPEGARVRILNIRPRFNQGIELKPGKYHVEVSAAGYATKKKWVDLGAGEDKTIDIRLGKFGDVLTNSLGMKFVFIRPGSFVMGSPHDGDVGLDDEAVHRVTLTKGFYMQNAEVTVGHFRRFIKATGYKTEGETTGGCWVRTRSGGWKKKKESNWKNPGSWETAEFKETDGHPVTCVSWNDARAFIKWLSRKEGMTYGLPTEAEWEYACRAGTSTPFAFGPCLSTDQANYGAVGPYFSDCQSLYRADRKRPIKVATLAPNPWGLFDMHGNVSEWCKDWYGQYPEGPVTDPKGPSSGAERVMRGGHWFTEAHGCRSAKRSSFRPDSASDAVGFRLVMRP